jgi:hypothetical protein
MQVEQNPARAGDRFLSCSTTPLPGDNYCILAT